MADDGQDVEFTMSAADLAAYQEELKVELAELKQSQEKRPSKYKADRIKRLTQRLDRGIEKV